MGPILLECPRRFEPAWARIISGVDEGVYGWIALNYALGTLRLADGDGGQMAGGVDPGAGARGGLEGCGVGLGSVV